MKGNYHIWRYINDNLQLRMETEKGSWGKYGEWGYWSDHYMLGVDAVWNSRQAAQKYAAARWDKATFIVLECRFEDCRYCSDQPGDPLNQPGESGPEWTPQ